MILTLLAAFPFLAGTLVWLLPKRVLRRTGLFVAALLHTGLAAVAISGNPASEWGGALALDPLGKLFLGVLSLLFLLSALYTFGYMAHHRHPRRRYYVPVLLFFLGSMTLATLSHHMGLFWVALEATTLSSAPLVFFDRSGRSLEAAWKYLILCSVGIALALAGTFFLALAQPPGAEGSLLVETLTSSAATLSPQWLKAAFLLLLCGYGTKMGLAPMHTWLPDAHAEAPPPVSALLSGALLNCAFLGVLRAFSLMSAAGLTEFARKPLLVLGLLSMGTAAAFLVRQADYKRMLAYSSVEHMGVLAVGLGLGSGPAAFATLLHAVNHSLAKGLLFYAAGIVFLLYGTKAVERVTGLAVRSPVAALLLVAGFLAITGTPPFGLFVSEFALVAAAFAGGHAVVGGLVLLFFAAAFVAIGASVISMVFGAPPEGGGERLAGRSRALLAVPALLLLGASLTLGLFVPQPLQDLLHAAALSLGVGP